MTGINELKKILRFYGPDSYVRIRAGRLSEIIEKIEKETVPSDSKRLLPKGMEWPRFVDDEPVAFHDKGLDVFGRKHSVESVKFTKGGFVFIGDDVGNTWWGNDCGPMEDPEINPNKRVKRPATKVLDANGDEIGCGNTVWDLIDGAELYVVDIHDRKCLGGVQCYKKDDFATRIRDPSDLSRLYPVFAADGKPLREGQTVYNVVTGDKCTVIKPGIPWTEISGMSWRFCAPEKFTHEEPDSWEKIERDAAKNVVDYWGCGFSLCSKCSISFDGKNPRERYETDSCSTAKSLDIARRSKALAERGE